MVETPKLNGSVTAEEVNRVVASKIAILVASQVGMTGKSTVAANVLHSRIGGRLFSVDSVNQDATQYGAEVEPIFVDKSTRCALRCCGRANRLS
jgi:hypothetical protein